MAAPVIRPEDDVLVLCYHAISSSWRSEIAVTPGRFRSHLIELRRRGYTGVTFTDAAHGRGTGKRVAVTFDDGYRSVHRLARPILDELGMSATVFIPTLYIGRNEPMSWPGIAEYASGPDSSELLPMSWEELGELARTGWEIGSHTESHPRLTGLSDAELNRELLASRAAVAEGLGSSCTSIAYPYGDVDNRVAAAARDAGYEAGAALMYSAAHESPLSLKRIAMHQPDSRLSFRIKTSPLTRRAWRSPAWGSVDRLVSAFRRITR